MKPLMRLSPDVQRFVRYPLDPTTGRAWHERAEELATLEFTIMEAEPGEEREEATSAFEALRKSTLFGEKPAILEETVLMGAGILNRLISMGATPLDIEITYLVCHPDTWAAMPDDEKARFNLYIDDSTKPFPSP